MSLEEANKIRKEFVMFMEVAHPELAKLFQTAIPESTLPYPKEQIEQAIDICIEFLKKKKDKKAARAYEGLKLWLRAYTYDSTALTVAHKFLRE